MGSSRLKKATIYILTAVSAVTAILVVFLMIFGEKAIWHMVRPEDESLIGDQQVPETLTDEILNKDIIYLRDQILQRTPYATAFIDTSVFLGKSNSLIAESANPLKLFRLAVLPMEDEIAAGHTNIPVFQRPLNWEFYPFYAYIFEDGLWIVKAGDSYDDIEGARILEINQIPVEDVLTKATPYIAADNDMGKLAKFSSYLSYAGFLTELGIVPDDGTLELTIERSVNNKKVVSIEPVRLFSLAGLQWGQTMQQQVDSWSPADPRPRSRNYWFKYLEEERAIYFQFNRVQNQVDESISEFIERLADFVKHKPIDRFIVDIRSNGGGNNQLINQLIDFISGHPKIDQKGVLYTLIGRRTYSAAGAFAMAMELQTKTLFVGDRSGFTPNHLGDAVKIALPNSQILVNISSRFWQDGGPYDTRKWIVPDIAVPLHYDDHANDTDPALLASLSHKVPNNKKTELPEADIRNLQRKLIGTYEFDPLRSLQISKDSAGFAHFRITYINDWAYSRIYPLNSESTRFATDIKDVYLQVDKQGQLTMDWKGVKNELSPLGEEEMNAVNYLHAIPEDTSISVGLVTGFFYDLKNQGVRFDSQLEFLLNRTGYRLLNNGRTNEAISIFELQTDLFPTVANGFDSLGEGYLAVSANQKAKQAFEKALKLDPSFTHAKEMLEKIK